MIRYSPTFLFFVLALFAITTTSRSAERPNMLIIMTDQHSADAMSCRMGERGLRIPDIDFIAARGMSFSRAYVANPICVPARTALLTGRYPHETGIQSNDQRRVEPSKFLC